MNGKIVARILAVLVLIAVIAGIAFFAFNAGVAQGVAMKLPPLAAGQTGSVPYPYYGIPFFWHPFPFFGFGFGCFGPLIALFLLFIALRAVSFLFWGPRWGYMGHRAGRHGWGENGVPPMFQEWHDRMHDKTETDKKE